MLVEEAACLMVAQKQRERKNKLVAHLKVAVTPIRIQTKACTPQSSVNNFLLNVFLCLTRLCAAHFPTSYPISLGVTILRLQGCEFSVF